MQTTQIKVGDIIRLKTGVVHICPEGREDNFTAKVQSLLPRGGIKTEQDLRGCKWWNQDDVEVVGA
jgi:hypothetical protein